MEVSKDVKNKIVAYYKQLDEKKLVLPRDSSKRQYRLHIGEHWAVIRDRLDTPKKLKAYLVHRPVYGVYATVGLWLNNTVLRRIIRNKRPIIHKVNLNPLLGSDYVVDIDLDFVDNRELTIECHQKLTEWGYKNLEIKFTGRGSQIIIPNFYKVIIADPLKRLLKCRQEFVGLTTRLLQYGLPVDFDVMNDWPTRVVKLIPNTITKHGTLCESIDITKINDFVPTKIFHPIKLPEPGRILSIRQKQSDGTMKYLYQRPTKFTDGVVV